VELTRFRGRFSAWVTSGYPQAARGSAGNGALSLKLTRRLHRIEALPPARQKLVLQTLDTLLKGASS
jgi:hypothetical protein